jgi:N-acetylmuramoyl-L-alanine amidase
MNAGSALQERRRAICRDDEVRLVSAAETEDGSRNKDPLESMLRLLLIPLFLVLAWPAAANSVSEMRVIGNSERTRFVIDLEKSPDFGILRLANPYRLVIDLPAVTFGEPATPGEGRGLISDYRHGLIAAGKARIVLDLAEPASVVNTFVLDAVAPEPARLVIDLAPTSAAEFETAAREDRLKSNQAAASAGSIGPRNTAGRPVVVIDPGHGGIDSGAIGEDGLLEKEVTLKFAKELARQIELGARLQPILTRSGDEFLSLTDRVEVARRNHAALFVSIHADSVQEDYVRGVTVYTLSDDASDAIAAALAARENRSDILAGLSLDDQPDDVADILFDLARRETKNRAIRFAKSLVKDIGEDFTLNANPWRRAAFKVLKAPEVPSVLLELGYLSNKEDETLFRSADWPRNEAEAVAGSIETFFGTEVTAGQ